jgi:hypothetical protein
MIRASAPRRCAADEKGESMEKVYIAPTRAGLPLRPASSAKKVVVTTTVDLDEADNAVGVTSSAESNGDIARGQRRRGGVFAERSGIGTGVAGTAARSITCLEVAPHTYLGLTDDRRRVSLLQVDDNVFIFAPKTAPAEKLEDLVARVLDGLRAAPRGWKGGFAVERSLEFAPGFAEADVWQSRPAAPAHEPDELDLVFNR